MASEVVKLGDNHVEQDFQTNVEDCPSKKYICPSTELSIGVLDLYQKDLKPVKDHVEELIRNQEVLRDITQNEITQINESIMLADIAETFENMKIYHRKLIGMKKEMSNLTTRIEKFKLRGQKLQLQKEREELEVAQEKERQRKYERELTAKTAGSC